MKSGVEANVYPWKYREMWKNHDHQMITTGPLPCKALLERY